MIFDSLTDAQVAELAREDFSAARESRKAIEDRKIDTYRMYRTWRKELGSGGKGTANGPFGWSRLTDPVIFTIIETILPRIGVNPPRIIATAKNPQAVYYQQAKQMRLNQQMKAARWQEEALLAFKQFLLFGDGPVKTPWDADLGGPRMLAIDWFQWFVSVDAARWHEAECLMQRTWHTERSLKALVERDSKRRDEQGKRLAPLYDHDAIEALVTKAVGREAQDSSYSALREATGLGSPTWGDNTGPISLVEMHYRDGSMAVIDGDGMGIAIRVEREPMFLDPKGRPFRPFAVFQNTPDLFQPYGISDAEVLEDFQHESTTIKNQAIDQTTGNLNAPKGYNRQRISGDEVQAAWSTPNGLFPVDGDPREAVYQYPPGQLSGDYERQTEMIWRKAQQAVGVNDVVQGITGTGDQTATENANLREEANKRFQFKLVLIELAMQRVACNWDWLDRRIARVSMTVPLEDGFQLDPTSRGITPIAGGQFARVDTAANAPDNEYEIELDAGSMAPPGQSEQANKARALIADLSLPQFTPIVNWPELARVLVEAHGQAPERVLVDPQQVAAQRPQGGAPPGPGGQPPGEPVGPPVPLNGAGADAQPSGPMPVGPPIPLGAS